MCADGEQVVADFVEFVAVGFAVFTFAGDVLVDEDLLCPRVVPEFVDFLRECFDGGVESVGEEAVELVVVGLGGVGACVGG